MWPVNGTYTRDQRDLYGFVIEYHKAFMRRIRPGVTPTELVEEVAADMREVLEGMSFSKEIYREACKDALDFKGHFQHPVGMSVHDVGRLWGKPLEPGMVFAVDPMIWVRPEELYIRMEDIVVVTEDGVENLSANLPIEMDEIETDHPRGWHRAGPAGGVRLVPPTICHALRCARPRQRRCLRHPRALIERPDHQGGPVVHWSPTAALLRCRDPIDTGAPRSVFPASTPSEGCHPHQIEPSEVVLRHSNSNVSDRWVNQVLSTFLPVSVVIPILIGKRKTGTPALVSCV